MKKVLKIILFSFLGIIVLALVFAGSVFVYSKTYKIPEQDETIINNTGLVQQHNRSLYDSNGNKIQLKGVNAGNILLQEGWMSVFALEPLYNDDGSYVKDKDGNIQYPEFSEEEFRLGLKSNPLIL